MKNTRISNQGEKMPTLTTPALPVFETTAARESYFRKVLGTARKWAYIGLLELYRNQTATEQGARSTFDRNDIGFNSADASIGSSFAEQLLGKIRSYGDNVYLSPKQDKILFKIMSKYTLQVISALEASEVPGIGVAAPVVEMNWGSLLDDAYAEHVIDGNASPMTMFMSGTISAVQTPSGNGSASGHCGLKKSDAPAEFPWEVTCVASELDSQGFVIDNQDIKKWFDAIEEISVSCETVARIAANVVWSMMEHPYEVRVKLWGLPGVAFAEVTKRADD